MTDIQIAQAAQKENIVEIAKRLGLTEDDIEQYGKYKAKINLGVITYDDKGNEKEIRYYDGKGVFLEERSYTYKFDNNGNWIERIESINQFPKSFLEREITYYP